MRKLRFSAGMNQSREGKGLFGRCLEIHLDGSFELFQKVSEYPRTLLLSLASVTGILTELDFK